MRLMQGLHITWDVPEQARSLFYNSLCVSVRACVCLILTFYGCKLMSCFIVYDKKLVSFGERRF